MCSAAQKKRTIARQGMRGHCAAQADGRALNPPVPHCPPSRPAGGVSLQT